MEKMKYDIVVIGAGIGGLCAAAKLSKAGLNTVTIEKYPILGGRYTHVDYKGYKLPTGAWAMGDGKESPVWRTLEEVGTTAEIELGTTPYSTFRIKGKDYVTSTEKKGVLKTIISAASRDKAEAEGFMSVLRRAIKWQEPSDTLSIKEWILQYTDSESICNVFQVFSLISGMNIIEYPAGEFIRLMRRGAQGGAFFPKNGLKDIIDALAKAINEHKGQILSATRVTQIIVNNSIANGVIAKTNKGLIEIEAEIIVSNVGPIKTIELAGEENFDKGYLKEIRERIRSAAGMNYYLASDKSFIDYEGALHTTDTRRVRSWMEITKIWPHWAPQGKQLTISFSTPESTIIYNPKKEAELFLQDLKDEFPKFEECGGQLLSMGNFCGNWPVTRSWPGYMVGTKTPIENLYNVGDATNPPGYVIAEGASESGRRVANEIISARKPG